MTNNDAKSSVQDEQFGKSENMKTENPNGTNNAKKKKPRSANVKDGKRKKKAKSVTGSELEVQLPESSEELSGTSEISNETGALGKAEKSSDNAVPDKKKSPDEVVEEDFPEPEVQNSTLDQSGTIDTVKTAKEKGLPEKQKPVSKKSGKKTKSSVGKEEENLREILTVHEIEGQGKEDKHTGIPTPPKYIPEKIDFTKLSMEDLVKVLKDLLDAGQMDDIRKDIEAIKSNFYKKHKVEVEEKRKNFLASGGQIQDFKVEESPVEIELKELLNRHRELRNELSKKLEGEKESNLEKKYRIIEGIKELANSQESLNKTFQEFRDLQNQWREIGPVPQQNLKDLWESYHYHVEAFYDYIKINKELRDLDLRRNLEAKIKLCETAEELLLEPSVVEAFRKLQKLHDQWREIGPVSIDKRAEIWERFKEATTKINKKHQEYFVNLKQEQKKNYEEKLLLCEKVEKISTEEITNHTEWEERSHELIELQKIWKTIGFAPKKYNTQIYDRFRKACDAFFNKKREYYSQNREEQQNNLQLKTELCIQAEALQESTDWKKTTDELIALQKRWKEIGPVPMKQSDKIWKRFRAACDHFFNSKAKFYSEIDTRYEENLEKKIKLIETIENFELTADVESNLKSLKDLQREWSDIGFVPLKHKNEIQDRYRRAINNKFDQLKLDDNKKALLKFRDRVENIVSRPNAQQRLRMERDKLFNRLKQMENDITLWENNIGFFADSENAESMINDVNRKIESAKSKIEQLKGKIKMLDEYED